MSSLPQIFKSTQSAYIRPPKTVPKKQGGIFSVKYQTIDIECAKHVSHNHNHNLNTVVQPEQFYSVKMTKGSQSRVGTSHTMRSKIESAMGNRNVGTSESMRCAPSRSTYSRNSTYQIRKDIFTNYGNPTTSFVINQAPHISIQQAESLVHVLNQNLGHSETQQIQMQQILKNTEQLKEEFNFLEYQINKELQQIQQSTNKQVTRLRELLSDLRKKTGMETKVNKLQFGQLERDIGNISIIMEELDSQSGVMYQTCLR